MKRVAILLSVLILIAPCAALAQTGASSGQDTNKERASVNAQAGPASDQPTKASLKIEDSDRITLRNRFGPIVVTGIGGDTLEASAVLNTPGTTAFKFQLVTSRPGQDKITIATAVITGGQAPQGKGKAKGAAIGKGVAQPVGLKQAPQPKQPQPVQPPLPQAVGQGGRTVQPTRAPRPTRESLPLSNSLRGVGEIRLEVKLPRKAHIELIDSRRYAIITTGTPVYLTTGRNDVTVTNVETPISITSSGNVQLSKVGGVEARTRAGNVSVKEVSGQVNISTVTGAIMVKDAEGDVRAISISGTISIECARGRSEASTTGGIITLTGIGGDVDASTTDGSVTLMGMIRVGGRYRLRSMSGQVRMLVQKDAPGFTASLSSYKGQILVGFPLKMELSTNAATSDLPATQGQPVRRIIGRYNDGDTRISLDSFSGTVQLASASSEVLKKCQ